MDWCILNTLDLSGVPEAVNDLEEAGSLITLPAERESVLARIGEFDAYLASASVRIDAEFLDRATRLKVIGSPSTGTDHMDVELIRERDIALFDIAREYDLINGFTATSELAFGLLLALVRRDVAKSVRGVPGGYLALCAVAGIFQGLAVAALFQALSRAPVTVVSPIYASQRPRWR